ncbi:MAG: glycosyltransferase [Acidobacteriota bacterium]
MTPRLTVVIPTRNRWSILERTLAALEEQTPEARPFEAVVVDDGSSDETPVRLAAFRPRSFAFRTLRSAGRGPAAARNAGIALAAAPRVILLGDDTMPRPDALGRHLSDAEAAVGRQGYIAWHPEEEITPFMRFLAPAGPQFYFANLVAGAPVPYTAVLGSNLSAPTSWFREERFDERFPAAAFEDTELAFRWRRRGWTTLYSPDAVCWHSHRYDAIEPFLKRQRVAGRAARYAVRKHPSLILPTFVQPLAVGLARSALARLRPRRVEDDWEVQTRRAFFQGWFAPKRGDRC